MVVLYVIVASLGFWLLRRQARKSVEPPSLPGSLPVIGHTYMFVKDDTECIWEDLLRITQESSSVGGIGTTNVGPWTIYVISDPEAAQAVLTQCLEKDKIYEFWDEWLGQGLLTGKVNIWKHSRKILLPAFSQRCLDEFLLIFNKEARKMTNKMSLNVDGEPFDIYLDLAKMGFRTVFKTILGQYDEKDDLFIEKYLKTIDSIIDMSLMRVSKAWLHINAVYNLTGRKITEREITRTIHNISREAITIRKEELLNKNSKINKSGHQSNLFIDLLIENNLQGNLSEDQMIHEINTIIFGGYDTSAVTLVYVILLLGTHRDYQDKVAAEIRSVIIGEDDDVKKEDIPRLVYTEAVIKEALRLYPIMSFLSRNVDQDLKVKNYTLHKGARCLMMVYGMHRHSSWGPDADQFRPERWLDSGSLPDCPAAFSGFSYGKRGCIGKTYAMLSMKTALVHLLRKYEFVSDISNLQLKFHVIVKPKSGNLVTIHKRKC